MELNDDSSFGPFGFNVAKETRELDENINECKSCSQRAGRADHNDPSVTLPGKVSAWLSLKV